jgi:fructose-1,6-bisphosphatase/inositol monophosphatase family enzyme
MARTLRRHMAIYEKAGVMPWMSCMGSAVLIMCWIAAGRVDAYHHNSIKPWDNAAAFVVAREAGAVILDLQGKPAGFTTQTLLIGTPGVVEELRGVFAGLDQELLRY